MMFNSNELGFTRLNDGTFCSKLLTVAFPFTVNNRIINGNADWYSFISNMGSGNNYAGTHMRILTHTNLDDYSDGIDISVNLVVKGYWK